MQVRFLPRHQIQAQNKMKQCSKERGCEGKINLGSDAVKAIQYAEKLKIKFGKDYGVYRCPHCVGTHVTTKLENKDNYRELLWSTQKTPD